MGQIFHAGANTIARAAVVLIPLSAGGVLALIMVYVRSSYATRVDVVVDQPVPFSHQHHVEGLGLDCRYCHGSVETSAFAGMPATQVCMNCHAQIWTNADMLEPVRASLRDNRPLRWRRVHDLPDHVYFDHSIHVSKGIGCAECHGRVDQMPLMRKVHTLHMQWCLECHRNPRSRVRPPEEVFNLGWERSNASDAAAAAKAAALNVAEGKHLTDCSICHR